MQFSEASTAPMAWYLPQADHRGEDGQRIARWRNERAKKTIFYYS